MRALDEEMKQAYQDLLKDQLRPNAIVELMCKQAQDRWNALPWHKKKWHLFKAAVWDYRKTIGFWIAGETPNNDY